MASPVTIYPSDDARTYQGTATTNYGTYAWTTIQKHATVANYSFFKFSTATIPAGVNITSAIMYTWIRVEGANTDVQTKVCDADWAEGTITWNNQPGVAGSNLHTWTHAVPGWVNSGTDLTVTFKSWYSGAANNYGIRLSEETTSGVGSELDSKETATSAQKPYFIVTYTLPSGGFGFGNPWIFMKDTLDKGKKYFKKKGLWLPDDRLFRPEGI